MLGVWLAGGLISLAGALSVAELAAALPYTGGWYVFLREAWGRLAGFLFGWVGESEFGMAARTGWIDLIGVDPAYRGRGVGQALVDRFVGAGRELRAIGKVATLIDLGQADVREFFVRRGFRHGPMVQLERELDR